MDPGSEAGVTVSSESEMLSENSIEHTRKKTAEKAV
jgi:hypothetical protein